MIYKVEVASEVDKDWVCNTASVRMLSEEVKRPELVNYEQIEKLVDKGIADETLLICFKEGIPVGVIGGLLIPNLFNPSITVLAEIFWYVIPEARDSRAGILLLKAFEEVGKQKADEITLSLLIDTNNIKVETMEKRGYMFKELGFLKEI